jgi:hypothetical protein
VRDPSSDLCRVDFDSENELYSNHKYVDKCVFMSCMYV